MHEAFAPVRRDPPETRRPKRPPKTKTVALPVSPPAVIAPAAILLAYAVISAGVRISIPSGITPVST